MIGLKLVPVTCGVLALASLPFAAESGASKPPAAAAAQAPAPAAAHPLTARPLALPGSGPDGVGMDYLLYDSASRSVWVPAGNTGSVDVIQGGTGQVRRVEGFPTAEVERRGRKRTIGPSSATSGDGVVYVGNRGDSSVCPIDRASFKIGTCVKLDSSPDGLAFVAPTKEIWVTTPRDQSITILDASIPSAPRVKSRVPLEGQPEGYAVDAKRGIFYTNFEDKDRTLAIDVHSHKTLATWKPDCGEDGPKGLALDAAAGFLFVACPDHAEVLDAGHDGAILSKVPTGAGVDSIDYFAPRRLLFVAAGQAATLTVAAVSKAGVLSPAATGQTAEGSRAVVVDEAGAAYVADSRGGRILVFPAVSR